MLVLPSEITFPRACACLATLVQGLDAFTRQAQGPVVVDAAALAVFDSSALAVMLAVRRGAIERGRGFSVNNLHAGLAGLAALYGVESLLPATAS